MLLSTCCYLVDQFLTLHSAFERNRVRDTRSGNLLQSCWEILSILVIPWWSPRKHQRKYT